MVARLQLLVLLFDGANAQSLIALFPLLMTTPLLAAPMQNRPSRQPVFLNLLEPSTRWVYCLLLSILAIPRLRERTNICPSLSDLLYRKHRELLENRLKLAKPMHRLLPAPTPSRLAIPSAPFAFVLRTSSPPLPQSLEGPSMHRPVLN